MRCLNLLLAIISFLSIVIVNGCTTSSEPSPDLSFGGSWKSAGLNDIAINNFNSFQGSIYAATDQGLYEKMPGSASWIPRGLQQDSVLDVVFLPDNKLLAATHIPDFSGGTSSLFLSTDNGQTWQPHMGNYGGKEGKYTIVNTLAISPDNKSILFARGSVNVSRSLDGGETWKSVFLKWKSIGSWSLALKINPHHPNIIWSGGSAATGLPKLSKSMNGGDSWEDKELPKHIESSVTSIAINTSNSHTLLIGMASGIFAGNIIRKSTDDGETWHTVQDSIYTLTLAHSARDPQVVYASGKNQSGTLFFAASRDFGDTWQTITMANSPIGIYVNDMASVMQGGHEVLYLATNKGVYRYTFKP